MAPNNLLVGSSTIFVGGAAATGIGFALKPSYSDQTSYNSEAIHSHNYLVFSRKTPSNSVATKVSCVLDTSCKLFNWHSKESVAAEAFQKIKPDNAFVLNIDNINLQHKQNVEVVVDEAKYIFVVQSKPNKQISSSIEPVMPTGLMRRTELIAKEKTTDGIKEDDVVAIQSKRFLNSLEPTYIERGKVNHDAYLIFQWKTEGTLLELHKDTTDGASVDKYIFRTIEDQKKHQWDDGYIAIDIDAHDAKSSFVEIYEIKDQANIKEAIESTKNSGETTKKQPNWEALSKESLMITKLSQLEEGKFYKLVMEDFSQFQEKFAAEKTSYIQLDRKFVSGNSWRLMKLFPKKENYFCVKFPNATTHTNKCALFDNNNSVTK